MKLKREILFVAILVILVSGLLAKRLSQPSKNTEPSSKNQKLQVITSFYPLFYFSSEIAGNLADVGNITPSGAEPHDYEPTSGDMARIEKSDLLILNGGVEAWGEKIKETLKGGNTAVVTAGEDLISAQTGDASQKVADPHVWLDPSLAKVEVNKIAGGFEATDTKNSGSYRKNAQDLETKLDLLDAEFRIGLANCREKDIFTSHAAFGYLTKAYGLKQVALAGLSPDAEPSAKDLVNITRLAKDKNIQYIFFESLVSPKLSETVAGEIGAKILVLDPMEGLSDDSIKSGNNYFTVMRKNLANLRLALQCQ